MNIANILLHQAEIRPQVPAIIDGRSRPYSFGELQLASSRAARMLRQAGLQPGDAVLVLQPMSAELYMALMGIFQVGAIGMFLDPSAGKEHIDRCCAIYPPQALIASSKAHLLRLISPALRQITLKFTIGFPVPGAIPWKQLQQQQADREIHPCTAATPALLTFTSGSTGKPKAAMRTHGFLLAQHRVLATSLKLTAGERDLTTLPIFLLANLASGMTSIIPNADLRKPGEINAAAVMNQIKTYQPTSTGASPAFLERIAAYCEQHHLQLPSFQKIFSGGAPVFPQLLERLQKLAPQAAVEAVYGSTEAEPIAHITLHEIKPDRPPSHSDTGKEKEITEKGKIGLLVGVPVPEIQLRIIPNQWEQPIAYLTKEEFIADCLGPGQIGEIVVSGEHVLPGYLHGEGDGETKFRVDGTHWHRTGDAGYIDERGRLWLMGRCSACIQDVRGTIYPFAVECVAHQYPVIRRAAFVSHEGKRILAVELQDKAAAQKTLASLKESLHWAHIDAINLYKKIPVDRRHNAKIDYPALKQLLNKKSRLGCSR